VDQREPVRVASLEVLDRALPLLEVEIRRGRWRQNGSAGVDANTRGVARIERPVAVEVGDVMRRVARGRKAREAEDAVAHDVHVVARHRSELTPERVECVAVEPACAALQSLGVNQVRRADLGDVYLQLRMLAHEHAGRACVVEVDVTEQEMPHVRELHALRIETALQRGDRRRRSAVEQRGAVFGVE